MFRYLKNQFKVQIYKDDLKYVIINGLLAGIFMGLGMGVLDSFLAMLGSPFGIGLFIIGEIVGRKVKKSYFSYHILYPILAVVFCLIGVFGYFLIQIVTAHKGLGLMVNIFSFWNIIIIFLMISRCYRITKSYH